jgi:hypothetical protein
MRRIFTFTTVGIILLILISGLFLFSHLSLVGTAASEPSLSLAQSGLVFTDPLNGSQSQNQLQTNGNWSFGGHFDSDHITDDGQSWQYSANGTNNDVNLGFYESGSGLSIAVEAVASGPYTGFYAISPPSDAELFHARITSNYSSIPAGFLQVGLYVRAASGDTNYIACASISSSTGTHWEIIHGIGNMVEATAFDYLWIDNSTTGPTTADCTIVTNGNNYLAVFLNGALIYQNSALSLGIQKPVEAYLGVESSYSRETFSGLWSDFYATQTDSVEAINLPAAAANVSIVGENGSMLGSATANNGTTLINIAKYTFPVTAYIKVYDSNGNEVASTSRPVELMGGDIYSAKSTIQQQVGSVVGFVSDPTLFYILIPLVVLVLAVSLVLSYSRNRRKNMPVSEPSSY